MKSFTKTAFGVYLFLLLWLVLFKTSLDIGSVITHYQTRSLNLIPFTGRRSEMIENLIIFIPFGLLLSIVMKRLSLWQKLAIIFVFSLGIETIQYVLAIGVSDITDVITNTLGGLFGLAIYAVASNYVESEKIDRFIALLMMILVVFFLLLRFFVFKVRY